MFEDDNQNTQPGASESEQNKNINKFQSIKEVFETFTQFYNEGKVADDMSLKASLDELHRNKEKHAKDAYALKAKGDNSVTLEAKTGYYQLAIDELEKAIKITEGSTEQQQYIKGCHKLQSLISAYGYASKARQYIAESKDLTDETKVEYYQKAIKKLKKAIKITEGLPEQQQFIAECFELDNFFNRQNKKINDIEIETFISDTETENDCTSLNSETLDDLKHARRSALLKSMSWGMISIVLAFICAASFVLSAPHIISTAGFVPAGIFGIFILSATVFTIVKSFNQACKFLSLHREINQQNDNSNQEQLSPNFKTNIKLPISSTSKKKMEVTEDNKLMNSTITNEQKPLTGVQALLQYSLLNPNKKIIIPQSFDISPISAFQQNTSNSFSPMYKSP